MSDSLHDLIYGKSTTDPEFAKTAKGSGDAVEPTTSPGDLFTTELAPLKMVGKTALAFAKPYAMKAVQNMANPPDKLKKAARALAKKDAASSEWMWNPAYHKTTWQPTWLDKFLHTAPPAPEGPPAAYKHPMWHYDLEGNKVDLPPQSQFIAEQSGMSREDVINESRIPVYGATEEQTNNPAIQPMQGEEPQWIENTTGKKPFLGNERNADYEDEVYAGT